MYSKTKIKIGIFFFLILLSFIWYFSEVLYPYILGMVIAYALDPLVDRLEKLGVGRILATIAIFVTFLSCFLFVAAFITPLIFQQLLEFISHIPDYLLSLKQIISTRFPGLHTENSILSNSLSGFGEAINSKGITFVETMISSSVKFVSTLSSLLIVIVVAFYLLLDWNRLVSGISNLIPRKYIFNVRFIATEIDKKLASFLRGQLLVCLILSLYYSIGMFLVDLQHGILVGFVAGIVSFIPFVGSILGGGLALLLALIQFWDNPLWVLIILLVFIVGQVLEGNILSPWLVGRNIGLHPVTLLFSISIFTFCLGFTGLLMAVPLAAILGVFVKYLLDHYKETDFYKLSNTEKKND
jgi:predicted PurR-regulated permease PerM